MLGGLASALLIAAPIAAQLPAGAVFNLATKRMIADQAFHTARGLRLPVINYAERSGSLTRSSGIIAGMEVAPRTTLGIGLFNMRRSKSSPGLDTRLNRNSRGGKKAAIGISMKF